jgi:hypothetical protein
LDFLGLKKKLVKDYWLEKNIGFSKRIGNIYDDYDPVFDKFLLKMVYCNQLFLAPN